MAKVLIGRTLSSSTDSVTTVQGAAGVAGWPVKELNQLIPEEYDYISLSYTGSDITGVVYKTGGAGGATVATLALAYAGGNLSTVTRT
jgi:hypothetical protein